VAAPLCAGAEGELASHGARAGEVRVRVECLGPVVGRELDLAAVGANARRASEDSTSVAYLQPPGPAVRFSKPILEEATIATVTTGSGKAGMRQLLGALQDAGSSSLRESVRDSLNGS